MARVLYDLLIGAGLKDVNPTWIAVYRNADGSDRDYPENRVEIRVELNPQ
jgi:hypothetical protein